MDCLTPTGKAALAIRHTLTQIRENPILAYHCGFGTQTFHLLTEAAADLFDEPASKVREMFMPRN